ncbi:MAG: 1-deoxy-D-xylulose-5-phosphate synthase [Candidatus Ancillula sp.]|jgi:1-deoxy-D-xylulose-5-phosphate synthase|nr:1-deoxy-D-xylulose-5-phosphate synthase [Candidatus Ancillula sp.]
MGFKLLESIKNVDDVKELNIEQLTDLADEMRQELLSILAKHGGHLGPNLGIIETAVALHYVFDSPQDKIVWDVSHQSLPHKILTGRLELLRKFHTVGSCSAFTNIFESEHDHFNIGHTSTAISLASGLVKARNLSGDNSQKVIAIVGDGALSGGEALEGLNIAGTLKGQFIIIVNDNEMSIDYNSGGLYKGLAKLRETQGVDSNNIFNFFGLDYRYIENGNDVQEIVKVLNEIKNVDHPIVLHIHNKKAFGYSPAYSKQPDWHYHAPFDLESAEFTTNGVDKKRAMIVSSIDDTVQFLEEEITQQGSVAVIPGAPLLGTYLHEKYPDNYLDVGIAEQSAVAFGSGIAKEMRNIDGDKCGGNGHLRKPYMVIASSFIQRAYDQVAQDWTMNNTPAVLIVLGGAVADTDYSHQGIYDIALLSNIPNLVYLSPTSEKEYRQMLDWAACQTFPVAIRSSGGQIPFEKDRETPEIETKVIKNTNIVEAETVFGGVLPLDKIIVKSEVFQKGKEVAFLGLGQFFDVALDCAKIYEEKTGVKPTIINPRFISHLDEELLLNLMNSHSKVVTIEAGIIEGGFGQKVAGFYSDKDMKVIIKGVKREYIDSVALKTQLDRYRLTPEQIVEDILK